MGYRRSVRFWSYVILVYCRTVGLKITIIVYYSAKIYHRELFKSVQRFNNDMYLDRQTDRQTYRQTYRQTDMISMYSVLLLCEDC
jgi:hypothetical protein